MFSAPRRNHALDQPVRALKHLSPGHPISSLELNNILNIRTAEIPIQMRKARFPDLLPLDTVLSKLRQG